MVLPGKQELDRTFVMLARDGEEMNDPGLYVVLQKWGAHAFHIEH